jgi:Fe-S-cluster containining protein
MKKIVGECNRCGRCCEGLILVIPSERACVPTRGGVVVPFPLNADADTRHYYQTRGCRIVASPLEHGGEVLVVPATGHRLGRFGTAPAAFVQSRCPHLEPDTNLCDLHDTPQKPKACREGPGVREILRVLKDRCSLTVVEA